MTPEDRSAIDTLFANLATVERQTPSRDPEAERLIRAAMDRHPAAAYHMAQTIIMQQKALEAAQRRMEARPATARAELARQGGGFLSGMGGGSVPSVPRGGSPFANRPSSPFRNRGGGGGGFLAGAAQTAMGVAGGVLLGNALFGMFDTPATAEEMPAGEDTDPGAHDEGTHEDGGYEDGGFDEGE